MSSVTPPVGASGHTTAVTFTLEFPFTAPIAADTGGDQSFGIRTFAPADVLGFSTIPSQYYPDNYAKLMNFFNLFQYYKYGVHIDYTPNTNTAASYVPIVAGLDNTQNIWTAPFYQIMYASIDNEVGITTSPQALTDPSYWAQIQRAKRHVRFMSNQHASFDFLITDAVSMLPGASAMSNATNPGNAQPVEPLPAVRSWMPTSRYVIGSTRYLTMNTRSNGGFTAVKGGNQIYNGGDFVQFPNHGNTRLFYNFQFMGMQWLPVITAVVLFQEDENGNVHMSNDQPTYDDNPCDMFPNRSIDFIKQKPVERVGETQPVAPPSTPVTPLRRSPRTQVAHAMHARLRLRSD